MTMFSELADHRDATSLAARRRAVSRPVAILDVGGTADFWDVIGLSEPDIEVTLLNLEATAAPSRGYRFVRGDARDLSVFADQSVDIVYSNSVIELFGLAKSFVAYHGWQ